MKRVSTIVFFAAFLGWAWLEFGPGGPQEGLQDILFWVGMGALLASSWDNRPRQGS